VYRLASSPKIISKEADIILLLSGQLGDLESVLGDRRFYAGKMQEGLCQRAHPEWEGGKGERRITIKLFEDMNDTFVEGGKANNFAFGTSARVFRDQQRVAKARQWDEKQQARQLRLAHGIRT